MRPKLNAQVCGNCRHWCSYMEEYDDEEEPDDIGTCSVNVRPGIAAEPRGELETCDKFQLPEWRLPKRGLKDEK